MIDPLDRRRNAIRADLADARLKDRVARPRYASPRRMAVGVASVRCRAEAGGDAFDTEFVFGELVDMFAYDKLAGGDLWAWVQSAVDAYVGYVEASALVPLGPEPTHVVAVPTGIVYPHPTIKRGLLGPLPMGAAVHVREIVSAGEDFALIDPVGRRSGEGDYVLMKHLRPKGEPPADFVAIAELFVGVPYVWGGKSAAGIDCSGLVQLALAACGQSAPRDSDMQAAELGEPLAEDAPLRRGDLVFWRGHVGIMVDGTRLLHANGHHMMTAVEPLAQTTARLAALGLPVTGRRRPGLS